MTSSYAKTYISVMIALSITNLVLGVEGETVLLISLIRYGNTNPEFINFTKYGDQAPKNRFAEPLMLTEVGKRQMFLMGRYYQMKYPKFLGDNLKNNDVTTISSESTRTVMAAHSFLLGISKETDVLQTKSEDNRLEPLFLPFNTETKIAKPTFETPIPPGWNTIAIQSTAAANDTLLNLNSKEVCPNRNMILSKREKDRLEQYMKISYALKTVADIYGIDHAKINFTSINTCYVLFSLVQSDYYRKNNPIISKTGNYSDIYNTLEDCSAASLISTYGNEEDIITDASNLFINISKTVQDFIFRDSNTTIDAKLKKRKRKFVLYSSHKKSFFPAMVILGMSSKQCVENRFRGLDAPKNKNCFEFPHAATHISFEVIRVNSTQDGAKPSYWVKVYFQDQLVTLPNQPSSTLSADSFLKYINSTINLNWEADCGLSAPTKLRIESHKWLVLLVISNTAFLIIIVFIFWYMWKKQPPKPEADIEDETDYSIIVENKKKDRV